MHLFALLFSMLLAAQVWAQNIQPNTWVRSAPGAMHPGPGGDVRWIGTPDGFVMFGGDGVGAPNEAGGDLGYRRNIWHYQPKTNEWLAAILDAAPGSPFGRCQPALAYVDEPQFEGVYMRSGATSRSEQPGYAWGTLWKYDRAARRWTDLGTNELGAGSEAATRGNRWLIYDSVNKKLLVIGRDDNGHTGVWSYDFLTKLWTRRGFWLSHDPAAPNYQADAREENGASMPTVFDRKAGIAVVAFPNATWRYEYASNRMQKSKSPIHPQVHPYTGFVHDQKNGVNIMYGAGVKHDETWIYDAVKDLWTKINPAASPPRRVILNGSGEQQTEDQFAMSIDPIIGIIAMWGNEPSGGRDYPVWLFKYSPEEIDIASGVWTARALPGVGVGAFPDGGKHGRWAFDPDDGRLYEMGGDYTSTDFSATQSGRNEIWSLSLKNGDWIKESPYHRDDFSLANPDEVIWTWDSRRKKFWMKPGFFYGKAHPGAQANAVGANAYTFDPVTKVLLYHATTGRNTNENGKFGNYDPVTDRIYIPRRTEAGNVMEVFNPTTLTYSYVSLAGSTDGVYRNNPPGYVAEYSAIDIAGRYIYLINPRNDHPTGGELGSLGNKSELLRYHIDTTALEFLMYMPVASGTDHNNFVFDTLNRVLLIPYQSSLNSGPLFMQIYNPVTNQLVRQEVVSNNGLRVKCNQYVFEPHANAMMCIGGFNNQENTPIDIPYYWLYRYAGSATPGPAVPAGPSEVTIQIKQ